MAAPEQTDLQKRAAAAFEAAKAGKSRDEIIAAAAARPDAELEASVAASIAGPAAAAPPVSLAQSLFEAATARRDADPGNPTIPDPFLSRQESVENPKRHKSAATCRSTFQRLASYLTEQGGCNTIVKIQPMIDQLDACIAVRTEQYNSGRYERDAVHYERILWLIEIRDFIRATPATVNCMEFKYEPKPVRGTVPVKIAHTMKIRIGYTAGGPRREFKFDSDIRGPQKLSGGKQRKTRKRKNNKRKTRRNRK